MINKIIPLLCAIFLITLAVVDFYTKNKISKDKCTQDSINYVKSLDSLKTVCDSLEKTKIQLKDTIIKVDKNITTIKKYYEKAYNDVISQSTDSDCIFFAEYLSENSK